MGRGAEFVLGASVAGLGFRVSSRALHLVATFYLEVHDT